MPLGRPSKYDEKYCEMLVDHMAEGYSFESFAAVIDVNRDTLYEWAKVHPVFSDAKKRGFDQSLFVWEKFGIAGLWGSKDSSFNAAVWIFNMKNRHNWKDKVEHTGDDDDAPISIAYVPKSQR